MKSSKNNMKVETIKDSELLQVSRGARFMVRKPGEIHFYNSERKAVQ